MKMDLTNQAVDPTRLSQSLSQQLDQAQWLLVGTLPLASPDSGASLTRAVEEAKAKGVAITLDINWRPTFW